MGLAGLVAKTLFGWQRSLVFPRHLARHRATAVAHGAEIERWWVSTDQGDVEAWFMAAPERHTKPGGAVIFAHGNAEVIDQWPHLLGCYLDWGMSVLLPEYRGYGRSAGTPSQDNIVGDVVQFWDKLVRRPHVDPSRIVLHGRSLGGGVACAVASKRTPAALVLQSTFTSISTVARRYGAPKALILDPFDNLDYVASSDRPMLIIHGTADRLIPVSHAHALHAAAARSKLLLYEADHNDCPPNWADYVIELEEFLRETRILEN